MLLSRLPIFAGGVDKGQCSTLVGEVLFWGVGNLFSRFIESALYSICCISIADDQNILWSMVSFLGIPTRDAPENRAEPPWHPLTKVVINGIFKLISGGVWLILGDLCTLANPRLFSMTKAGLRFRAVFERL